MVSSSESIDTTVLSCSPVLTPFAFSASACALRSLLSALVLSLAFMPIGVEVVKAPEGLGPGVLGGILELTCLQVLLELALSWL